MAQFALRPERYGGTHDNPTPPGMTLGRKGTMEVRVARNGDDIKACQTLRYRVFYEELSARPDHKARLNKVDADGFDAVCDHMLVIDHDIDYEAIDGEVDLLPEGGGVVGTYRLLRQEVVERHGGFYSVDEFDI